jgi:hypothetical protein
MVVGLVLTRRRTTSERPDPSDGKLPHDLVRLILSLSRFLLVAPDDCSAGGKAIESSAEADVPCSREVIHKVHAPHQLVNGAVRCTHTVSVRLSLRRSEMPR